MYCTVCDAYFRNMIIGDQIPKCNNPESKHYRQSWPNDEGKCNDGTLGMPNRKKYIIYKGGDK